MAELKSHRSACTAPNIVNFWNVDVDLTPTFARPHTARNNALLAVSCQRRPSWHHRHVPQSWSCPPLQLDNDQGRTGLRTGPWEWSWCWREI